MPPLNSTLKLCILPIGLVTSACSATLQPVQIAQIPLRPELRQCVALDPMPPEALPPVSEDPAVRSTQLEERAAWMMRDIHQADIAREMCNRQGELIGLIDANNAGPEN